jgi:endoglucanase
VRGARLCSIALGMLGLAGACGSEGGGRTQADAGSGDTDAAHPVQLTGCAAAPTQPVAPGGYYVNGNTICTADGRPHLLHGVDRPSLEWTTGGLNLSLADFRLMASWNANVVRIPLNQDYWLASSPLFDPNYAGLVDTAVAWAETEGMDVIVDLHWSDRGVLGSCLNSCQQQMPDANSVTFWSEVAARYRNDGRVIFELYNEPHDVSWSVWKSGGTVSDGFQAVGMQQLYDTVRSTGAENLVIIGGLNWGYDLSGVPANRIDGHNISYVTHPYNAPGRRTYDWDQSWGFLTETDPVVITEFGENDPTCVATAYSAALIKYADAHAASWTAWGWYPDACPFQSLIDDWTATPSPLGSVVKAALLGYGDPPASPPGVRIEGPDLGYTFDAGTEGWVLNNYDDPSITNLGARVPDGGSRPTLGFAATDGDPSPGALALAVAFTAPNQDVVADVAFGSQGIDLSGKTLNVRVRLVSGSLAGGGLSFYACSGGSPYVCTGPNLDSSRFAAGTWVPLTLDLGAATEIGFDAKAILEIGVQLYSSLPVSSAADGGTTDGGSFAVTGQTVFEIDTVTD